MKPSGAVAGIRACSSGRLLGRLLEQDRVARAGARRARAGRGRRAAARRRRRRRRGGGVRGVTVLGARRPPGERRADRGGLAEDGELDRAAVRLLGVLRDQREARRRRRRAGRGRTGTGAARRSRRSGPRRAGRASRAGARAARAGGRRTAGDPAGSPPAPPNGSWKTGQLEPLGEGDQRRPARVAVRAGAGDDRRAAAPSSTPASASTAAGSAACGAQQPLRPE